VSNPKRMSTVFPYTGGVCIPVYGKQWETNGSQRETNGKVLALPKLGAKKGLFLAEVTERCSEIFRSGINCWVNCECSAVEFFA
jgi:hypothetical protein